MPNFSVLILGLCLLCSSCVAKNLNSSLPTESVVSQAEPKDSIGFPETWVGVWLGELAIYNAKGLAQKLPMELHITPTDSTHRFTWKIIYGADKEAGARNYELVVKDRAKGEYVVDELNSIALECYLIDNKLFSWYLVENNLLLITYEVNGEEMTFEVIAGSHTPVSVTGGKKAPETTEEEEIPAVSTYPVSTFQRANLMRRR